MNERLEEFERLNTINNILIESDLEINEAELLSFISKEFSDHKVSTEQMLLEIKRIYKWRVSSEIEKHIMNNLDYFSKEELLNDLMLKYEHDYLATDTITSSIDEVIKSLIIDNKILVEDNKYIVNHIEKMRRV